MEVKVNFLAQMLFDAYGVDESFTEELLAANLPTLTEAEACVFADGYGAAVSDLISKRPELKVVEDFLGQYAF